MLWGSTMRNPKGWRPLFRVSENSNARFHLLVETINQKGCCFCFFIGEPAPNP